MAFASNRKVYFSPFDDTNGTNSQEDSSKDGNHTKIASLEKRLSKVVKSSLSNGKVEAERNEETAEYCLTVTLKSHAPFTAQSMIGEGLPWYRQTLISIECIPPEYRFKFLELPVEVRQMIYLEVLGTWSAMDPIVSRDRKSGGVTVDSTWTLQYGGVPETILKLLRVCRQIFGEACPLLYRSTIFRIDSHTDVGHFMRRRTLTSPFIQKIWVTKFTPSNAAEAYQHIKRLENLRSVRLALGKSRRYSGLVDGVVQPQKLAQKLGPVLISMLAAQKSVESVIDAFELDIDSIGCKNRYNEAPGDPCDCSNCELQHSYLEIFQTTARALLARYASKSAGDDTSENS